MGRLGCRSCRQGFNCHSGVCELGRSVGGERRCKIDYWKVVMDFEGLRWLWSGPNLFACLLTLAFVKVTRNLSLQKDLVLLENRSQSSSFLSSQILLTQNRILAAVVCF